MRHLALLFAASFSLSLEASELPGQQWPMAGKVIYVSDGDTLTILQSDFSKLTVRLSDIDAPETSHGNHRPGQPYSQASKQSLSELAKGKQATATCYEFDRHERPVCTVLVNGQNVNAEQLRRGIPPCIVGRWRLSWRCFAESRNCPRAILRPESRY